MRVLAVTGAAGRPEVVGEAARLLVEHSAFADVAVIDNGSAPPYLEDAFPNADLLRLERNVGNYPLFDRALGLAEGYGADVVAVLHGDLYVWESDWDRRVEEAFELHPDLGLLGFVGSAEMDENGGRGSGTTSNFEGRVGGGRAEDHGRRSAGLSPAAIVDGCAMVFRTEALERIGFRPEFPPHHFYDRLMSCQVQEAGFKVAVLGVSCDHLGGMFASQQSWADLAREWCLLHGVAERPESPGNWDYAVYREAERQFLWEWREVKHFIPRRASW